MELTASVYWLLAAALLFALEAFGVPGIGFLFAAIAAFAVGVLIHTDLLAADATLAHFAVFFLLTSLLALALWRKLKQWRLNPNAPHYHNIVGTEAVVTAALIGDAVGEVRWSGTLMRARLVAGSAASLPVGATVIVRAADGNLLMVAPK